MGIKTVYIIPEYPRPCQSPEDFVFESEDSLSTLWIQNIGQVSRTLGFRALSSEFWVPSLLPAWASLNQHLSESKNPSQTVDISLILFGHLFTAHINKYIYSSFKADN